jgi:hypothetical protein
MIICLLSNERGQTWIQDGDKKIYIKDITEWLDYLEKRIKTSAT